MEANLKCSIRKESQSEKHFQAVYPHQPTMTFNRDFYYDGYYSPFGYEDQYSFGGLNGYRFGSPYGFYRDQYRYGSPYGYRSFGNLYGSRGLNLHLHPGTMSYWYQYKQQCVVPSGLKCATPVFAQCHSPPVVKSMPCTSCASMDAKLCAARKMMQSSPKCSMPCTSSCVEKHIVQGHSSSSSCSTRSPEPCSVVFPQPHRKQQVLNRSQQDLNYLQSKADSARVKFSKAIEHMEPPRALWCLQRWAPISRRAMDKGSLSSLVDAMAVVEEEVHAMVVAAQPLHSNLPLLRTGWQVNI
ncbi:Epidermal differentiation protein [Aix galericulata]|nr:Epidermal differentiation protein [Aix galericulata]